MNDRSSSALESDTQSEKLMAQREYVLWFYMAVLGGVEAAVYFYGIPSWVGVVFAIGWLGWFLANELKLILHELVELNDQITGRKDEFRKIMKK